MGQLSQVVREEGAGVVSVVDDRAKLVDQGRRRIGVDRWSTLEEGTDALAAVRQLLDDASQPAFGGLTSVQAVRQRVGQSGLNGVDHGRGYTCNRLAECDRLVEGLLRGADLGNKPICQGVPGVQRLGGGEHPERVLVRK